MRFSLLGFLLMTSVAWATTPPPNATVFPKIDQSTSGWDSCTGACAGGVTANAFWMAQNQTTPSLDGSSTLFHVDGKAFTDVLFYNKLGPHDSFTHFQSDFWVNVDSNSTIIGQALEFDTFQFVNGREYMFGTQCDYAAGVWEVWNAQSLTWQKTRVVCPKFVPNVWYHITWNFHRNNGGFFFFNKNQFYDNFTVVQFDAHNNVVSNNTYVLNLQYPSGALPVGWTDTMGIQFQVDLNSLAGVNGNPSTINEYVDKVTVTAW